MSNRRFFLKALAATLLPIGRSLACSGEWGPLLQTVPRRHPPFPKESLADFITYYLGSSNWRMDKNNTVDIILNSGQLRRHEHQYVEDIGSVAIRITLPERHENKVCTRVDVFLENPLDVYGTDRDLGGLTRYLSRSKIITFSFPVPGQVTSVGVARVDFGASGRVISIAHFEGSTGKKSSKTLVTVSHEVRGYCRPHRTLALSYDDAVARCERLRSRPDYVAPEKIESYVSQCKQNIRYE